MPAISDSLSQVRQVADSDREPAECTREFHGAHRGLSQSASRVYSVRVLDLPDAVLTDEDAPLARGRTACGPRHLTRRSGRRAPRAAWPAARASPRAALPSIGAAYRRSGRRGSGAGPGATGRRSGAAQRAHEGAQRGARRSLPPRLQQRAVDPPAAVLEHQRHGLALRQLHARPAAGPCAVCRHRLAEAPCCRWRWRPSRRRTPRRGSASGTPPR